MERTYHPLLQPKFMNARPQNMKRTLACLAIAFTLTTPAYNCCSVTGKGFKVEFVDQANIIVWDPATKTEHFIRNAKFATKAGDLGFIAPSPSKPELAEVDPKAFEVLSSCHRIDTRNTEAAAGGEIVVVQVQNVAGFQATTVMATDPAALGKWMKQNGYVSTPTIEAWTKFYIDKKWFLTLFKVVSASGQAQTGLVRMSFKTDKPFNPYLVPKDNVPTNGSGSLALFFVGPGEYKISNRPSNRVPYREWTGYVSEDQRAELSKHLKLASLPKDLIVTAFATYYFPNPTATDDLYFERSGDGPAEPKTNFPLIVGFLASGVAAFFYWRMTQRKASSRP